MKVTVLGKSPSWQDEGGACTGYIVEHAGFTLLLDCGSGVFGKLRQFRDYLDVDAVLISHLHADHFLDLMPFASAIVYGPRAQEASGQREQGSAGPSSPATLRPPLYAPSGAADVFRRVAGVWNSERLVESAFEIREYDGDDAWELGPFQVRFCEVPHYVVTYAVELAAGGRRLTFGADCSPNEGLVAFAADTDLLLIEATLTEPERDGDRGHLTAGEAGEHARRARARRVVLTHFSDELDPARIQHEAEATFGGELELAAEGAVYEI